DFVCGGLPAPAAAARGEQRAEEVHRRPAHGPSALERRARMIRRHKFDALAAPSEYPRIIWLELEGGGGHRVIAGSFARRDHERAGEVATFQNADGAGMVLLHQICGVTLAK